VGASFYGDYADAAEFEARWRALASSCNAVESVAGRSVEGRPLWRFDFGSRDPRAPVVLLTALIHGVELIGSVALFDLMRRLSQAGPLADGARFVVIPIVNPDALAANMDRLRLGNGASQRKNARGVDLNRNFPLVCKTRPWHPFAGSRFSFMPHYRGPHPLSEPESRAIHHVATELRPAISLGFHSFGNMLLYPWAHTRDANPRLPAYRKLAQGFTSELGGVKYRCQQAVEFYPTIGDLDDWLDVTFGTLALTVEVGGLDRRLFHPLRFINVFCWMNPTRILPTVGNLIPGLVGLLEAGLIPRPVRL
jgi:carboxypeptidase T